MCDDFHIPVLVDELLVGLGCRAGETVLDATVGDGGYLAELSRRHEDALNLIGMDADSEALDRVRERFSSRNACNPTLVHSDHRYMTEALAAHGITELDRIIFDLGLSSYQIDHSGRGFSFRHDDEPLSMSFHPQQDLTAYDVVNTWDQDVLETIIRGYGEERYAGRIARVICESREERPIETTGTLREIITSAVPAKYRHGRLHPATRTFQAIRMAVNDEMSSLDEALGSAFDLLTRNGRCGVISFHSLEDRRVKNFIREKDTAGTGRRVTKKPIRAGETEREANPRSRSAKLRIIEKL